LWPVVVLLFLHLVNAAAAMGEMLLYNLRQGTAFGSAEFLATLAWPMVSLERTGAGTLAWRWALASGRGIVAALPQIPFHLTWPVMLMILARSRRQAKIRKAHLLRGMVYGMAWWLLLPLFGAGVILMRVVDQFATSFGFRTAPWSWGFWSGPLQIPYVE